MKCLSAALLLTLPALAFSQTPLKVDTLTFSQPATVVDLDMGKLKGEPSRLAWSADGKQFYVQTTENRGRPNAKVRHYIVTSDGKLENTGDEPKWAAEYWIVKSGQTPPDNPALKIEIKTEQRQQRTTSAPMAGDMARGGVDTGASGTSAGDAGAAAYGQQDATVHSMMLKGQTIGEFVNSVIVPGVTFGWGPKGSKVIAYTTPKGGELVVMDFDGTKTDVRGAEGALLPAWSSDASRLAWLQRDGRRKYLLKVAEVTSS